MLGVPEWAMGVGLIIVLGSVAKIVVGLLVPESARRSVRSRFVDPADHSQALEGVQARLGELDQLKQRVAELEERLDFAERMLASQREAQRLGPPPR